MICRPDLFSQVNTSTNLLTVLDPSYLNYEHLSPPAALTVTIKATDTGSPPLHVTGDVTITVIDINELPDGISLLPSNVSVPEDVAIGHCIAQFTSQNPEPEQTVTFTLLNFRDEFEVAEKCWNGSKIARRSASSRSPYLQVKSHLSYNKFPTYDILVNAIDNGSPPQSFNGSVMVRLEKVDPCHTSISDCHSNSTCKRVDWQNYTCPCIPGFTGNGTRDSNCVEIDECQSNPCLHNGTCFDAFNNYTCACPAGYYNYSDCSIMIDMCQSSPCQNGGKCSPSLNKYTCYCAAGYTGVQCETNINECDAYKIECVEGACRDEIARFACDCDKGFTGTLCQRNIEACESSTCSTNQVCVRPDMSQESLKKCFSTDSVITLYFELDKITPQDVDNFFWQWKLQNFIKSDVEIPYGVLTGNADDTTMTLANDVIIFRHGLDVDGKDNRTYTAIHFVVVVSDVDNDYGVPDVTFLQSLNTTCQNMNCKNLKAFECGICKAGYEMVERKGKHS